MFEVTLVFMDGSQEMIGHYPNEQAALRRADTFINATRRYVHLWTNKGPNVFDCVVDYAIIECVDD